MDKTTRVTGLMLIAAGALALLGNLLHPRYDEADSDMYVDIAHSTRFPIADLILLAALLLLTVGLASALDRLRIDSLLARAAYVVTLIGGTLAVATTTVELFGLRQQSKIFVSAAARDVDGSFWSTSALDTLNRGLFATWTLVLLGVAPPLIGAALHRAARRPIYLLALATVGGATCAVVAVINLLRYSADVTIPFLIGSLLVTAWVVGTGWDSVARSNPAKVTIEV